VCCSAFYILGLWTTYGHCIVAGHFHIVITTTIHIDIAIYGNKVYITFVYLYVYIGVGPFLYVVMIIFGTSLINVNLV